MEKEILLIIVAILFLCYSIYLKYFKEKYSHTWRKKSLVDKTVLKNMWDCDVLGRDTKTKSNDKNIERS